MVILSAWVWGWSQNLKTTGRIRVRPDKRNDWLDKLYTTIDGRIIVAIVMVQGSQVPEKVGRGTGSD